jgi:hypothetical protein
MFHQCIVTPEMGGGQAEAAGGGLREPAADRWQSRQVVAEAAWRADRVDVCARLRDRRFATLIRAREAKRAEQAALHAAETPRALQDAVAYCQRFVWALAEDHHGCVEQAEHMCRSWSRASSAMGTICNLLHLDGVIGLMTA